MPGHGSVESIDKPDAYVEMHNPDRIPDNRDSMVDTGELAYVNVREAQGIAGLERVEQPTLEAWGGEPVVLPINIVEENLYNIPKKVTLSRAVLREPTALDDLNGLLENLYTQQETLAVSIKHERSVRNACVSTGIASGIFGCAGGIASALAGLGAVTFPAGIYFFAGTIVGAGCLGAAACTSYGVKEDQQLARHQRELVETDNRVNRIHIYQHGTRPIVSEFIPEPPSRPQSFRHNSTSRSSRNTSESSHL